MKLNFQMAARNIFRHKRRSLLTGLSMAVGYILLSLSLSVTEGSYNTLIKEFTENVTGHIQIHKQGYLDKPRILWTIPAYQAIEEEIRKLAPESRFAAKVKGSALAFGKKRVFPASILGIQIKKEDELRNLADKIKSGSYFSSIKARREALLGSRLASSLNLDIGDDLVLISTGADGSIANDVFTVQGLIGSKDSLEGRNIYLSLEDAQSFFSVYGSVHEISILLDQESKTDDIVQKLRSNLKGQSKLEVHSWQEVEKAFYQSMEADKQGNNVSLFIIILMVSIGVLNTVLMSVLERINEYGLLRAIGVRPKNIISLVLMETGILASLSCLIGASLAIPINYWFKNVGITLSHPIEIGGMSFTKLLGDLSAQTILIPALVVVLSAILVSLYPALKAATVSPTAALQKG